MLLCEERGYHIMNLPLSKALVTLLTQHSLKLPFVKTSKSDIVMIHLLLTVSTPMKII